MMKTNNLLIDFVSGVVFFFLGYNLVFRRKLIVNALLESSKVFWGKIGITTNQKSGTVISNIMIPIMGVSFLIVSCLLIFRVIRHFL